MNKRQVLHWIQQRWMSLVVMLGILVAIGYCVYLWVYLPLPPLATPMFLLSPAERERICSEATGGSLYGGDLYDILQERRDITTPEANITLRQVIEQKGNPDGYVAFRALNEQRCYFLRLYWFRQGYSADTAFLPHTDKMTLDVKIRRIEYFDSVEDIAAYARQMEMSVDDLTSSYHSWTDIESIIYP